MLQFPAVAALRTSQSGRTFTKVAAFLALRRSWSTFSVNQTSLTIDSLNLSFPYKWLRDSCQCSECIHPSTRQKLRSTADIPHTITPADNGVILHNKGINIKWDSGHASFYPASFLKIHSSDENLSTFHKDARRQTWDKNMISKSPKLFVEYEDITKPSGLLAAIDQLADYGLLFFSGVPNTETSDETCELRTLAERFGEIRRTFYGELFDVKNVRNSTNIAYTNLDLGLHMDLLYFQSPPRYQILHCLRNRVSGGESIFVDAIRVAEDLRRDFHVDYDILTTVPVAFHYINDGHHLHYQHPTIQLTPTTPPHDSHASPRHAHIDHINYSPPFQAPLPMTTPETFFPAFSRFARMLADERNQYKYLLKEGDAVIFDNRRVLHARTAFHDLDGDQMGGEGETNRWLKGCYLEADAPLDRGRVLRTKAQDAKHE